MKEGVDAIGQILTRIESIPASIRAVFYMATAAIMFVLMHMLVRDMTDELHPFEVAFFRAFLGIFVLLPLLIKDRVSILRTNNIKLHLMRAVLNAGSMLCFFYGIGITPLAQATALNFTGPLFATVLAAIFLGELVRLRRWVAIAVGFLGTLIILRPGLIELDIGPLLIVSSAAVWSVALMIIKVMTRNDSSITISLYASLFVSPMVLAFAVPFWEFPTFDQLVRMLILSALGTFAQTLMNQSLKLGEISVVLPVDFTKLIWAAFLGFLIFEEIPNWYTICGGIIIFCSTTYIAVRSAQLKR